MHNHGRRTPSAAAAIAADLAGCLARRWTTRRAGTERGFQPYSDGERRSVLRHRPGLLHPPFLHIPPVFIFIPFRSSSQERAARLSGLNGHPSQ